MALNLDELDLKFEGAEPVDILQLQMALVIRILKGLCREMERCRVRIDTLERIYESQS